MGTMPKYKVEILGHEVTRRRLLFALSREELADKSGVSLPRLHKIEGGWAGGVSPQTVRKLCDALACDPSDISEVTEREVAS